MEQFPTTEPTPSSKIVVSNISEQSHHNIPITKQEHQQETGFFDPCLATKPAEQWSDVEIKAQREYARSRMEHNIDGEIAKIRADTERQIWEIEEETKRQVLDIAGETYIKMTEEIGLTEREAIGMIGEDKMNKIIGKDRVSQIKDSFDSEVMAAAVTILEIAYREVGATIDKGITNLDKDIIS